ncbi:MAG: tetratricopeptide repeat protein [Gammaproteobacteria bacterium]
MAADIHDAMSAMRRGDFAEAYCILRPHAEQGDADAEYNIGWMYLNGYGLAIDDSQAMEWWLRASKQGHIDANFSIAMLYSLGEGRVKKDMDKAIDYYLLAAEAGHEDARLILKSMLTRDDKSIRERKHDIITNYGNLLGDLYRVKVERANLRASANLEGKLVNRLLQGDIVIELGTEGKWRHVAVKTASGQAAGQVAWIYATLLEPYESMKMMSDEAAVKAEETGVEEPAPDEAGPVESAPVEPAPEAPVPAEANPLVPVPAEVI